MKVKEISVELKLSRIKPVQFSFATNLIVNWFFAYPEAKINLTELSRKLQISKKTASEVIINLKKQGFLEIEQIGKSWKISCNIQHPYNQSHKIAHNLSLVYRSGIIEKIYRLVGNPKSIILFGSYRKGDDISTSDLDIAVEVVGSEPLKIVSLGVISELGFRKDVPVNLHIFSKNKIDSNLFANIANGIVLDGFLEVKA